MNYPSGRVCQRQNCSSYLLTTNLRVTPLVIGSGFCTALCTEADADETKHSCIGLGWKLNVNLLCISVPESPV